MIHGRDHEWNIEGNTRRKRQRAQNELPDNMPSSDVYNEIMSQKSVNCTVYNSWLRRIDPFHCSQQAGAHTGQTNHAEDKTLSTLQRQLLEIKRKLWPSAERCSQACFSSPHKEFTNARRLCNPMEPLGEGRAHGLNKMFMNRAAIKLANVDALLDFQLTSTEVENFMFVDLCGAPGGFSEYIIKRLQATRSSGSCRGYGMSLTGENEHGRGAHWKLDHFHEQTGAFQTNYRVSGGTDGTGDIYRWENTMAMMEGIKHEYQSAGLPPTKAHLVMADGGFDAQRDSECQEALAQKLVICEMAAGLYLLELGGILVVKMFGFQTSLVRAAMHSMSDYFESISALKPISSRPASSERYVVFAGFRGLPHGWDGPKWMNNVFLERAASQPPAHYQTLNSYLDEFDRDLLDLNLKACFAILSTLDRKASSGESGYGQGGHRTALNIELYQNAWKLY